MRIGGRVGFDHMEELRPHFESVDFPVELALPYKVQDFMEMADRMDEVCDFVREAGIEVLSVHAAQGRISESDFRDWAEPAMWLADEVGARCVTFHPNQVKGNRSEAQAATREHVRELQKGCKAVAAVETFGGKRRVLRPEEIAESELPMVLDIAHIRSKASIHSLIESYHSRIISVHLSGRSDEEHHLPVDEFCLEIVRMLKELEWDGCVILEYLPWHHYRVRDDIDLVKRFLEGEDVELSPPDDKYRNDPSKWGYGE